MGSGVDPRAVAATALGGGQSYSHEPCQPGAGPVSPRQATDPAGFTAGGRAQRAALGRRTKCREIDSLSESPQAGGAAARLGRQG